MNDQQTSAPGSSTETVGEHLEKAREHLENMIGSLEKREKNWIRVGIVCTVITISFVAFSMTTTFCESNSRWCFGSGTAQTEVNSGAAQAEVNNGTLQWILLVKGILLASVPAALATYSFSISRAYIHERLKRQERKQAINQSELYLKITNNESLENLSPQDFANIFQWNIVNETAFSNPKFNSIHATTITDLTNAIANLIKAVEFSQRTEKQQKDDSTHERSGPQFLDKYLRSYFLSINLFLAT